MLRALALALKVGGGGGCWPPGGSFLLPGVWARGLESRERPAFLFLCAPPVEGSAFLLSVKMMRVV